MKQFAAQRGFVFPLVALVLALFPAVGALADGVYEMRAVMPHSSVNDEWFNPRKTGKSGSLSEFTGAGATATLQLNDRYDLIMFTNVVTGGYNYTTRARVCNPAFQYEGSCNASAIGRMPFTQWGIWDKERQFMTYSPDMDSDWLENPAWQNPVANKSVRFFAKFFLTPLVDNQFCIIGNRIDLPLLNDSSIPPSGYHGPRDPFVHRDLPIPYFENGTYIVCFEDVRISSDSPPDPKLWTKMKWLPHRMLHTGPQAAEGSQNGTTYSYHFGDGVCAPAFQGFSCHNKNIDPNGPDGQLVYIFGSRKVLTDVAGTHDAQIIIRMNLDDILQLNGNAYEVYTEDANATEHLSFSPNTIGALERAPRVFARPTIQSFNVQWSDLLQSYVVLFVAASYPEGGLGFHLASQPYGPWSFGGMIDYIDDEGRSNRFLPAPFSPEYPSYATCQNIQLHPGYMGSFVRPDPTIPETSEQWPFVFTCLPQSFDHLDVMFKPPPYTELYRPYWFVLQILPPITPPPLTPRPATPAPTTPEPLPPTPVPTLPTPTPAGDGCSQFSNSGCTGCTKAPSGNCGYCLQTKTCQQGTSNGAANGNCPSSSWEWYPDECQDNTF